MRRLIFQMVLAVTALASGPLPRETHECLRPCDPSNLDAWRVCTYKFIVARGIRSSNSEKISMERVINGSSPGPPIEICLGDTVVVTVENKLSSEEVTFHWHGLRQVGSPHMDGVPMISQCPILPYTSFRYEFKPESIGTYFYHAHQARQQGDGLYGSLTVRGPRDDPRTEKILLVSTRPSSPLTRLIDLDERTVPQALLLNGQVNEVSLNVESRRKYLLRLINANVFNCPISFFVDQHNLDVVACDGHALNRDITAERVILFPGERFDLAIEANQTPGRYIVGIQGLQDCRGLIHEAYFNYEDARDSWQLFGSNNAVRDGIFVDELNEETPVKDCHKGIFESVKTLCSLDLKGRVGAQEQEENEEEEDEPIETYYVPFDVYSYNEVHDEMTDYSFNIYGSSYYPSFLSTKINITRIGQINRMTFDYPSSPILSQPELVPDDALCPIDSRPQSCDPDPQFFCQCTQVLKLPPRKTVDIVLIDEGFGGNVSRTFHVHGYHVSVVGVGQFRRPVSKEEIIQLHNEGRLRLKKASSQYSLRKDSFAVPNKGYLVLRIRTDNIGYWLWEATSTRQLENGPPMQFVMLVGSRESMPTVPIDFPTCANHKSPLSIFEDNN